jgi:hypothetical protein
MSPAKLPGEFFELVTAGISTEALDECMAAQLATLTCKEYGTSKRAARALGVHRETIYRWRAIGRQLPIPDQLQSTVGRIAGALFDRERTVADLDRAIPQADAIEPAAQAPLYRRIRTAFCEGLAGAALTQSKGHKANAAKLLQVHRNWFSQYTKTAKARQSA